MKKIFRSPVAYVNLAICAAAIMVLLSHSAQGSFFGAVRNALAATGIIGGGNINQVAAFSDSATIGNSIIFDNGTSVGVGTGNPSQKLDVAGNVNGTGLCISNVCFTSWPAGPQGTPGTNGERGLQGFPGINGTNGTPGLAGAKGDTGTGGAAGPQGPGGPQGPAGATGPGGPAGPQGPSGGTGANGAQGPAGPVLPISWHTVSSSGELATVDIGSHYLCMLQGVTLAGSALICDVYSTSDGWVLRSFGQLGGSCSAFCMQ